MIRRALLESAFVKMARRQPACPRNLVLVRLGQVPVPEGRKYLAGESGKAQAGQAFEEAQIATEDGERSWIGFRAPLFQRVGLGRDGGVWKGFDFWGWPKFLENPRLAGVAFEETPLQKICSQP